MNGILFKKVLYRKRFPTAHLCYFLWSRIKRLEQLESKHERLTVYDIRRNSSTTAPTCPTVQSKTILRRSGWTFSGRSNRDTTSRNSDHCNNIPIDEPPRQATEICELQHVELGECQYYKTRVEKMGCRNCKT
jgi:hypothetical protein